MNTNSEANPTQVASVTARGTARDEVAGEVLHKFLILNRYLRKYARQVTSQGVRPRDLSVLLFLMENGPATVGQVQEFLYRSASVASTLVAGLEEAGYVARTRSPRDNRVVIVTLTQAGQQMAETAPLGGIPLLRRQLNTLDPERLERIDAALADLMELMDVVDEE